VLPVLLNMYVALHFKSELETQQADASSIGLSRGKKKKTCFSLRELCMVFAP